MFFNRDSKTVVRKLIKSSVDVKSIALFDRNKNILAYGSAPKSHEIELFRQQSKKRIVICLLLLVLIMAIKLSAPIFTLVALAYVSANTLFGWNKYSYRCISVFSLNILLTAITYIAVILYITNLPVFIVASHIDFLANHINIVPLILLNLTISLFFGYLMSIYMHGDIKVLSVRESNNLDINKIMKNSEIDKYVIDSNGDINRINVSAHKIKKTTRESFKTHVPKNIGGA